MYEINDTFYFESVYDFVQSLKENKPKRGRRNSSESTDDNDWAGTKNIDEAYELATNGWDKGLDDLDKEISKIKSDGNKIKDKLDVVGYQVNVPLYLNGVHQNMIRKEPSEVKNKIINIVWANGISCGYSANDILKGSCEVVAHISNLEQMGYRTNIWLLVGSGTGSKETRGLIKIKGDSERFNVKKMIFPLVHPSMLRRLCFRFDEVFPADDVTHDGYGRGDYFNDETIVERISQRIVRGGKAVYLSTHAICEGKDWRSKF